MDDMKKMLKMLHKQVKSTNRQLMAIQEQQQSGYVVDIYMKYSTLAQQVLVTFTD